MKNKEFITGLLLGAFAGGAAGITGCYFYMKNKVEEEIDTWITSFLENRYAKGGVEDEEVEETSNVNPVYKTYSGGVPKYVSDKKDKTEYSEYFDKKKTPQEIAKEYTNSSENLNDDNKDDDYEEGSYQDYMHDKYASGELNPIELCDEGRYDNDRTYEKSILFYWLGDDILTDTEEELILDKDVVVGDIISDEWIEKANADIDNNLYFINHDLRIDFCIEPIDASYYDTH